MHPDSVILGVSRRPVTTEALLQNVELCVNETDNICDPTALAMTRASLRMHQMSLVASTEYHELRDLLQDIETEKGICMDRLYYLSIPPQMFEPIVRGLGEWGLNGSCAHGKAATRLLIEKPFGYDLASAHDLLQETGTWFTEAQTYRIDHYVAKNAIVEFMDFRKRSPGLYDIWNDQAIATITITAHETIDIEGRTVFYDAIGALRDIIQSHLLQVLAVTIMDPSASSNSATLHSARLAALTNIRPIAADQIHSRTIRGQYDGYTDEIKNPHTLTETYAAIRLTSSNSTWQRTSIVLKTGKALSSKLTQICITFHDGSRLFCHIQPDKGLELQPGKDAPDSPIAKALAEAIQIYKQAPHKPERYTDAYERVLVEAAAGHHAIFTTSEEIIAAWKIVDQIVESWSKNDDGLLHYPKGASQVDDLP